MDDIIDHFQKNRYYDRWDENRWREQLEEHPLFMTKPPEEPTNIPPLVEAIAQLKYDEDSNSPEELSIQYKLDGNENYKKKKFQLAIDCYERGLCYLEGREDCTAEESGTKQTSSQIRSLLYSNRAACYVMMKDLDKAIRDCKLALREDSRNYRAKIRMKECLDKIKMRDDKTISEQKS